MHDRKTHIYAGDEVTSDGESDSDESDCNLQCSNLLLGPQHNTLESLSMAAAMHSSASSHGNLKDYFLVSCHQDGSCLVWDLSNRRCVVDNINDSGARKFGLAVHRIEDDSNRFLYHTRDARGTMSLHDLHDPTVEVMKIETNSSTFCTVSPCRVGKYAPTESKIESSVVGGENNLVALPTEYHSIAIVRDLRCNPQSHPAFRVSVQDEDSNRRYNNFGRNNKYGMLMSLALSLQYDTHRLVMGCGMEDGSVLFYDLGACGKGRSPWQVNCADEENPCYNQHNIDASDAINYVCTTKLGKEPVLSLDLATSYVDKMKQATQSSMSLVAVAGCAGDADEISDLPNEEQGTVTTLKVSLVNGDDCTKMKSTIRKRTQTCSISSGGKVGVSIARFRPDGRVFAVGGWDKRLRIFGRTSSKPLAILHGGHSDSVVAMDWAEDSPASGLLATGAGDGNICVYRVLPHTQAQDKRIPVKNFFAHNLTNRGIP